MTLSRRAGAQTWLESLPEIARVALVLAVFALYYVAPGLPLSLLLLLLCAVVCYLQTELAVSLTPLAMPFFMLPKHLGHPEFALGETAIALCAAAYLARALQRPSSDAPRTGLLRHLIPASPLERSIALFLLAATAATVAAQFRHEALRQYRWVVLEPIIYYVLVVALLRDVRAMTRALWAVAAAGLLVAVLGLLQYLFRPGSLTGAYWTGHSMHPLHLVTSVYGSPNNLGLLLGRAIPVVIVLGYAVTVLRRQVRGEGTGAIRYYVPWLAVPVMAVALVLSNSRAGIITAAVVSLLAALLFRGRRDRRLELAGVAAVALGAVAVLVKSQHGLSTSARIHVWLSGLSMIRDHPLLGIGPDNFLYYYVNPQAVDPHNPATRCIAGARLAARHYMDLQHAWQEPCLSHPHNVILDTWLSTGLIGLVAIALVLTGFVVLARHNLAAFRADDASAWPRAVQVACVAIVAATVAHGLVDNSIFVPDLAVIFWLAMALTGNLVALRRAPSAHTRL